MRTRSAKNKGRKLQKEVQEEILKTFPELEEDDVKVAIMGESGVDIKLSPAARKLFPYSIECKNQEKISIWAALKQAEENKKEGTAAALVFRKNHTSAYVAISLDEFLKLVKP